MSFSCNFVNLQLYNSSSEQQRRWTIFKKNFKKNWKEINTQKTKFRFNWTALNHNHRLPLIASPHLQIFSWGPGQSRRDSSGATTDTDTERAGPSRTVRQRRHRTAWSWRLWLRRCRRVKLPLSKSRTDFHTQESSSLQKKQNKVC